MKPCRVKSTNPCAMNFIVTGRSAIIGTIDIAFGEVDR